MKRFTIVLVLILSILVVAYLLVRLIVPRPAASSVQTVASTVEYIHQIGELAVLRASVKEIVTSKIGEAGWVTTSGKMAIICHFDIKYKYDLRKAKVEAGVDDRGERFCVIRLPKHEFDVSTKEIRFYDEQDGTWLGFTQKTLPDERTRALEAARVQAETQARSFLGEMEGEIQSSAKATLGQIARALGYTVVRFEFEK
jgi:Protein of unknown function (DUF4230)